MNLLCGCLHDWIGEVAPQLQAQIQELPTPTLEELEVALLDFNSASDLVTWLQNQ